VGCQRCQEAIGASLCSPTLAGDWNPLARAGLPLGTWVSDASDSYVTCLGCGARWVAHWDSRDQIFAAFNEIPPAAECLLRADTPVLAAIAAADWHPDLRWLLTRYLRKARYDGREALAALLERVAGAADRDACRDWLFTLEELLRGPQGGPAATALAASTKVLDQLRWRPDWRETDPARASSWHGFRSAFERVTRAALAHGPPETKASLQPLAAAADDKADALAGLRDFARGATTADRAVAEFGALDEAVRSKETAWSDEDLAVLFTCMERLAGVHAGRYAERLLREMFLSRLRLGALPPALAAKAITALDPDLTRLHRPAQFCLPERQSAGCGRCRAGAPEAPSATPYGDTGLGGAYWVPRAPGNGVLVCDTCGALWWRRRDPLTGQVQASVMPKSAQVMVRGAMTVGQLFDFLASPEYPAVRAAGGLMLAWHYFETEYWQPPEDTAALFTAAFRRPDPCFDVTCDRLELLRVAVAKCTLKTWPFPFDLPGLAARMLGDPAWLGSVLPSGRPAARSFVIELVRRILEVGSVPMGLSKEALADL
jgi:hypothetical protein